MPGAAPVFEKTCLDTKMQSSCHDEHLPPDKFAVVVTCSQVRDSHRLRKKLCGDTDGLSWTDSKKVTFEENPCWQGVFEGQWWDSDNLMCLS